MSSMKNETVTFKVDGELARIIQRLPNKSEFIRRAVMAALDNTCPLCQGTGRLTPEQKAHWLDFARHHEVEECGDCHAVHLHCDHEGPCCGGKAGDEAPGGDGEVGHA
jgi:hypothetical protein